MRILLQPAAQGNRAVKGRYERTIRKPVPFAEHKDLLSPDERDNLHRLFPGGAAPMWGLTPGKGGSNRKQIESFHVGDAVFFYSNRTLISGGTVAARLRNAPLARRLWGEDDNDLTWEHLYAISDLRRVHIPFSEVMSVIGWNPRAVLQQAYIVTGGHADYLAEIWGLDRPALDTSEDSSDFPDELDKNFEGELDKEATRFVRVEQGHLKRYLLARGEGRCALCDREFPSKLLVAAHIKKRAACTADEKRDLANVGMLACLFGCDTLYERGFIGVGNGGSILTSVDIHETPALDDYVERHFVDRVTGWWSPAREPYFAWHRSHTFRMSIDAE